MRCMLHHCRRCALDPKRLEQALRKCVSETQVSAFRSLVAEIDDTIDEEDQQTERELEIVTLIASDSDDESGEWPVLTPHLPQRQLKKHLSISSDDATVVISAIQRLPLNRRKVAKAENDALKAEKKRLRKEKKKAAKKRKKDKDSSKKRKRKDKAKKRKDKDSSEERKEKDKAKKKDKDSSEKRERKDEAEKKDKDRSEERKASSDEFDWKNLTSENLPAGWKFFFRTRKSGATTGHQDKYYVSPEGASFRSLKEIRRHCRP